LSPAAQRGVARDVKRILDAAMRLEFGRKWPRPRAKLLVAGAGLGEVR
jgi:hypothetical protein